jgi:hypothetical protein
LEALNTTPSLVLHAPRTAKAPGDKSGTVDQVGKAAEAKLIVSANVPVMSIAAGTIGETSLRVVRERQLSNRVPEA